MKQLALCVGIMHVHKRQANAKKMVANNRNNKICGCVLSVGLSVAFGDNPALMLKMQMA
jgi:hypothetical protein